MCLPSLLHLMYKGMLLNYYYSILIAPGLRSPPCSISRREACTAIGAVEVLDAFDLAAGPNF